MSVKRKNRRFQIEISSESDISDYGVSQFFSLNKRAFSDYNLD